jgi:phosphate acyltransferase
MITIAVDAMGGDFGPRETIPAVTRFLSRFPDSSVVLFGLAEEVAPLLIGNSFSGRLVFQHSPQIITSDESASSALRMKKQSSMRLMLNAVQEGQADCAVSAGNTGALVAISRFVLKTMSLVERPALTAALPNSRGFSYLLDLGANIECSSANLVQFAHMGSVYVSVLTGKTNPAVCLLNIGTEELKGSDDIRLAHAQLKEDKSLNYQGYIEPDELYKGRADVVVCGGFVGNVVLKTSEGLVGYVVELIRRAFNRNLLTRAIGVIALPVLERMHKRLNPDLKNGAVLLGLNGIVVKSHGKAQAAAFSKALENAYFLSKGGLLGRLNEQIDRTG